MVANQELQWLPQSPGFNTNRHSLDELEQATLAMPTDRTEDKTDKESLNLLLGEDVANAAEPADFSSMKFPIIEGRLADEDGTKRIFILSDSRSQGASGSDARSAFGRAFPMLSQWKVDRALTETLKDERHGGEGLMPVAKRDLENKLLRCMIGRVYRPCWKD
ncbi:pro-MCH [Trichomycterus rosablanca]|uniref:pro-MCH n=1 Tax=Trichomycterus rosablanca TaxID=2290929 RepID=UPI002F350D81